MYPTPKAPTATFKLAASPQRGSIVVPFVIDLPILLDISTKQLVPYATPSPMTDVLGNLADLAALALFTRDMVFGDRGLVARRLGQNVDSPPQNKTEKAIDATASLMDAAIPAIERMLKAAEDTGCDQIELQVNDNVAIKLIMSDRRRRSNLIARLPIPIPPKDALSEHVFNPTRPATLQRVAPDTLRVKFEGRELSAYIFSNATPMAQRIVVVWGASMPVSAPGTHIEVMGRRISRDELEPLEDVSVAFEQATDVFFAERARAGWQ